MELTERISIKHIALLFLGGVLIFLPFLGQVHLFDWDEINFAECAREMIILHDYLSVHIDFEPFWEKPPFFIWLQVLSMKIFGIGEYAARFPNAILGVFTLPLLYVLGTKLKNVKFGLVWALLYACSFLPLLYFKSGIIDPWFNNFIFLSYVSMYFYLEHKSKWLLSASGISLGLAILTKGPVALLILCLCAIVISILYKKLPISIPDLLRWILLVLIVPGLWFLAEYLVNGPLFIIEFVEYQMRLLTTEDAGHGGFPGYHFVVVLLGCFPASVFAFPYLFKKQQKSSIDCWMQILLWIVILLFSLVQSKIIHYSSLTYFPLTFLGAKFIHSTKTWSTVQYVFFSLISLFWVVLIAVIPFIVPQLIQLLGPESISKNAQAVLSLEVSWPKWLTIIALLPVIPFIIYQMRWNKWTKRILISACYILFIEAILIFYLPRVEQYTQHMVIEFFEEKTKEQCYIENWGYRSYADLFYTNKMPADTLPIPKDRALAVGVDKPFYIVTKVHRRDQFESQFPHAEKLYQKGEFIFYKRESNH